MVTGCLFSLRKKAFGRHSERSEESLLIQNKGLREILRPPRRAQNDGIPPFSANCYGDQRTILPAKGERGI
jgi:hypothetical protein